jgi:Immunoglobulin-like domain of bacterial spore germination
VRLTSALLLLSLLTAALLSGCLHAGQADQSAEASGRDVSGGPAESWEEDTPGTRGLPEAKAGAASEIGGDLAGAAEASSGVPFVAKTRASGGSGYDADTVLAVRHGVYGDYERTVIDLGTGWETAADVPDWTLVSPEADGLLRLSLPSASATRVSDGGFSGELLEDFYIVHAPEGGMFVDFFAREPFLYRVLELEDPARLVVDFEKMGGGPKVSPLGKSDNTVLVEPRQYARISDPLTVSGYSRNREGANTVTLIDSHGEVLARRTVQSNDWNHTWGYFEATLDLPPFSGRGILKVGTEGARDGSFEGIEVPIRASR